MRARSTRCRPHRHCGAPRPARRWTPVAATACRPAAPGGRHRSRRAPRAGKRSGPRSPHRRCPAGRTARRTRAAGRVPRRRASWSPARRRGRRRPPPGAPRRAPVHRARRAPSLDRTGGAGAWVGSTACGSLHRRRARLRTGGDPSPLSTAGRAVAETAGGTVGPTFGGGVIGNTPGFGPGFRGSSPCPRAPSRCPAGPAHGGSRRFAQRAPVPIGSSPSWVL